MDKFERQEILDEFLVRWKGGKSPKFIESELLQKYNPNDVRECRIVFERWINSGKPWSFISRMK